MAITAAHLRVILRWQWAQQQCQTVRFYSPVGSAFLTATAEGVGEAFWNHIKTAWRALAPVAGGRLFQSVYVEEIGGGQVFGEYAVPIGEADGLRATASLGDALPPFMACNVKFTVGTRVTRPGCIRLPFLHEADITLSAIQAAYLGLAEDVADVLANPMVLGAPVATGTLYPVVVSWSGASPPELVAAQPIVGYLVNPSVTTQRSRKVGRGT